MTFKIKSWAQGREGEEYIFPQCVPTVCGKNIMLEKGGGEDMIFGENI